jgi:small subunit ribosomal protein S13
MPRIAGIDIPDNKKTEVALTYIYGIGFSLSRRLLGQVKIDPNKQAKDLTTEELTSLRTLLDQHKIEGDLRREVTANIKRLRDIGAYRGVRHGRGLPARGQRTRTNSRTVRGNVRKTMGSGRKPASSPT